MTTTTSSIRVNSIMSQIGERRANVSVDAKSQSVTDMVRCIAIFYAHRVIMTPKTTCTTVGTGRYLQQVAYSSYCV